MKSFNDNLVCVETNETAQLSKTVVLAELEKKYKTLKVVVPDESGAIETDDIIYVPFRSVTKVKVNGKDYEVVNKRDIMFKV